MFGMANWDRCPKCDQMMLKWNASKHACNPKVEAKHDAEVDIAVDEAMETFNRDVKRFWRDKHTKFEVFAAERDRQNSDN